MSITQLLKFCASASALLLLSLPAAMAAQPYWIADAKTGCKVWNSEPLPKESVTWSGDCLNGKAEGRGTLTWYRDGIEFRKIKFLKTNGAVLRKGKGVVSDAVNTTMVNFKIEECSKYTYRSVVGTVSPVLDLYHGSVLTKLLSFGAEFAGKACPRKHSISRKITLGNILVGLVQNGESDVIARSRIKNGEISWNYSRSRSYRIWNQKGEKKYTAEVQRRKEEKKRTEKAMKLAKQEQERLALAKLKDDSKAKFVKFTRDNHIKTWPDLVALRSNPFVHEGNIVGLWTKFVTMKSKTQALFGYNEKTMLVSGVPVGLFTEEVIVLLAAKVIGKEYVKLPMIGDIQVLHLKFVGAHSCKDQNCNDILFWNK